MSVFTTDIVVAVRGRSARSLQLPTSVPTNFQAYCVCMQRNQEIQRFLKNPMHGQIRSFASSTYTADVTVERSSDPQNPTKLIYFGSYI